MSREAAPEPEALSGEAVLPAGELSRSIAFFQDLGFRVESIIPAESPRIAVLSVPGLLIRLDPDAPKGGLIRLRAPGGERREIIAPNGVRVRIEPAAEPLEAPPFQPRFALTRGSGEGHGGRAGMIYRDLLPPLGGRYVASLISIPDGGPVGDWVHHHKIFFQLIYCRRGWVRLVYEGQGPPFVLGAGELVLQPPGIRHRVLESSPGLEVIELSSPGVHETLADHALELPTQAPDPERRFDGQSFLRFRPSEAPAEPLAGGFERRTAGLGAATLGRVEAQIVENRGGDRLSLEASASEFRLICVTAGAARLVRAGEETAVGGADALLLPPGEPLRLEGCSPDLALLDLRAPA